MYKFIKNCAICVNKQKNSLFYSTFKQSYKIEPIENLNFR